MPISQLTKRGVSKTFKSSGGDVAITISSGTNLANGARRQSAQLDFGTAARTDRYDWAAKFRSQVAATLGGAVTLWWSASNGVIQDGNLGISDASLAADDKIKNLKYIGQVIVDISNTTDYMQASGEFPFALLAQYGSLVVKNSTGQAINDFEFIMTEILSQSTAS